jgi:hypothetical protein
MELEEDGPEAAGAPLSPAMELEEDGPGAAGAASHRCCWNLLSASAGGPLSPPLELEELEEAGGGVGGLVQVHDLAVLAVEDLQVAVVNGEPVQVPTCRCAIVHIQFIWNSRMHRFEFSFIGISKCIGSNSVSMEFRNVWVQLQFRLNVQKKYRDVYTDYAQMISKMLPTLLKPSISLKKGKRFALIH